MDMPLGKLFSRFARFASAGILVLVAGVSACYAAAQIDLNSASEKQLESINGVGPVRAHAIMKYRKAHHGFHSVSELTKVSGIGAGTLEKVRGSVRVGPGSNVAQ